MKRAFIILILGILIGFGIHNFWPEGEAAAKLVTIKSRNLQYQVETRAETVEELLIEQGLTLPLPLPSTPTESSGSREGNSSPLVGEVGRGVDHGITIEIIKPVSIIINDGGNKTEVTTTAATVNDLLYEREIALADTDRVFGLQKSEVGSQSSDNRGQNPQSEFSNLNTYLAHGMEIRIDRIVDLEVTEERDIVFSSRIIYDTAEYYGREDIIQSGEAGKKREEFLITYKNGVEIARKLLAEETLKNPVEEVRTFGTKITVEETEEGRASWYAYQGCPCAAHPFYEKGRYARVTELATGKTVIVRINDRGPDQSIHPDRVIDLDSAAYRELAPLGSGTIGVKVELLRN